MELVEVADGALAGGKCVDAVERCDDDFEFEFVDGPSGFLLERADISSRDEWSCCSSLLNSPTSSLVFTIVAGNADPSTARLGSG